MRDPFVSLPADDRCASSSTATACSASLLNLIVRAQLFLTLLITFGVEVVMVNLARILWSSDLRQVTPTYAGANFAVGGLTIPYVRLWVFVTTSCSVRPLPARPGADAAGPRHPRDL